MTDNANRSGVVTCMTVNEFERATLESDRYDVRVLHHKTVDTHSPAQIVLTSHLYNYIKVFMQEMRSQLPNVNFLDKQIVFLVVMWRANGIQPNDQSLEVNFQESTSAQPSESHWPYRKYAVSRCNDKHKEISGNLADLMAHRENTAQKYYRVLEKSKSSVKASQKLHRIMRNTEGSSEGEPTRTN